MPVFLHYFFFLMQPLTGRHPAAPVLDKVETRVGAAWLIQPYLIKDSISLLFSQSTAEGQPAPVSSAS